MEIRRGRFCRDLGTHIPHTFHYHLLALPLSLCSAPTLILPPPPFALLHIESLSDIARLPAVWS